MRISTQWISDFTTLPKKSPQEIGEELTVHTVEVEDTISQADALSNVVIGKILSIEKHPDADSLQVCQVSVGKETLQVVCGGANVQEGMNVAMGMIGAKVLWHGAGELVELAKTKIRGVESFGMICAAEEIGLGNVFPKTGEKDILDLSALSEEPGTPLADALGFTDIIYDIDNKSVTSRPDLWGHYGIAREFSAMYDTDLKPMNPPAIVEGNGHQLSVKVENQMLCPRYMAVQISGITVAPSPAWMQKRLLAVGVRPINNIVDITNYVMHELGQPMHAFDAEKIDTGSIEVRMAKKGETMVLLGGDEVELPAGILLITDSSRILAIAGVKGGADSGVTNSTTEIVFEAANFEPLSTRKTSSAIGVRTDASTRFEKGLDPHLPEIAMRRAVELTLQVCPGATVSSAVTDIQQFTLDQGPIEVEASLISARIGVKLSAAEIIETLSKLGFSVTEDGDTLHITVPSWRATGDIHIKEDIIEEVARMYGYANIPTTFPLFPITPAPASPLRDMKKRIMELLAYESGYTEVYNYSFVSPVWLEKFGISTENYIELAHPLAKDRPFVRRGLIPNMMVNVESNLHRYDAVRLFETGRGYKKEIAGPLAHPDKKETLPGQDEYLGLVYAEKGNQTPFFELSSVLRNLADRLGATISFVAATESPEYLHGGRHAHVSMSGGVVGFIAEIHPVVQSKIGIAERTAVVELNLSMLAPLIHERLQYTPLPVFPVVERDVALVVDGTASDEHIRKAMYAVSTLITTVQLFDMYQGEHIASGKKSLAYRVTYRDNHKTLTSEEVDGVHAQLVEKMKQLFGATLR